jgi:hypothetical protein
MVPASPVLRFANAQPILELGPADHQNRLPSTVTQGALAILSSTSDLSRMNNEFAAGESCPISFRLLYSGSYEYRWNPRSSIKSNI